MAVWTDTGCASPAKLDDPSFSQPIFANLFDDDGGESSSLIWSRPRRSSND